MKIIFLSCCIFCFCIFFSCRNPFNHNISISVNDDYDYYRFSAYYNKNDSRKVQNYINESIGPDKLAGDYIDVTTTLEDATTFYIKETPGELKIKLKRQENSEASYRRIKKMCNGIKDLLAGK